MTALLVIGSTVWFDNPLFPSLWNFPSCLLAVDLDARSEHQIEDLERVVVLVNNKRSSSRREKGIILMPDRDRTTIRQENVKRPKRQRLKYAPKLLCCHEKTLLPNPRKEQATAFIER